MSVRIRPSLPRAPVVLTRGAEERRPYRPIRWAFDFAPRQERQPAQNGHSAGSNPARRTRCPGCRLVRPADSKPAIGCSNHPRGAMRRNSKWRAAELQTRRARFKSAAALQVSRMRRSGRVAKVTGPENRREARKGPPGVEFPPPPPIKFALSMDRSEEHIKVVELCCRSSLGCKCVIHVFQFGTEVTGTQRRINHDARAVT